MELRKEFGLNIGELAGGFHKHWRWKPVNIALEGKAFHLARDMNLSLDGKKAGIKVAGNVLVNERQVNVSRNASRLFAKLTKRA